MAITLFVTVRTFCLFDMIKEITVSLVRQREFWGWGRGGWLLARGGGAREPQGRYLDPIDTRERTRGQGGSHARSRRQRGETF